MYGYGRIGLMLAQAAGSKATKIGELFPLWKEYLEPDEEDEEYYEETETEEERLAREAEVEKELAKWQDQIK